ncbi:cAMP-regulated phosphoprotein 19-like [Ixodes scapularis]|uniref:cAMP-regulated phosphoprotein 19-like n=1 Tax=Ixodes scapularis TaxID=6945 RepID=UPI001C3942F1|nr:cAMP-regulated phosphoprotein 19-like [Ixodes scapularis]
MSARVVQPRGTTGSAHSYTARSILIKSLHEGSELETEFKYPQVVGREKLRFLQKRQKKGQQRYFDSADYNMARARAHVTTPRDFPAVPQNDTGEAIPTVESLPPRNAAIEQSKLATLTLF